MKKDKCSFILNFLHPVYDWYISFFSKYYNTTLYSTFWGYVDKNKFLQKFSGLKVKEFTNFKTAFSTLYRFNKQDLNIKKNELIVVWDTFTNGLSYKLRWKKVLYYWEYILYKWKGFKNILFYILGFMFFYNKKIIVPTQLSYKTYSKISKNVFYFPQLYCENIDYQTHTINKGQTINLLSVAHDISRKSKNISFLIENYLQLRKKNKNIHLTLVWNMLEINFLSKYKKEINNETITYIPYIKKNQLNDIYKKSDIFIIPSIMEPIWSVLQEAMSNGCAILSSNMVGASCYVENWVNWFIFNVSNGMDFRKKLLKIYGNISEYKNGSIEIMKEKYRFKNKKLMNKMYTEFENFIYN